MKNSYMRHLLVCFSMIIIFMMASMQASLAEVIHESASDEESTEYYEEIQRFVAGCVQQSQQEPKSTKAFSWCQQALDTTIDALYNKNLSGTVTNEFRFYQYVALVHLMSNQSTIDDDLSFHACEYALQAADVANRYEPDITPEYDEQMQFHTDVMGVCNSKPSADFRYFSFNFEAGLDYLKAEEQTAGFNAAKAMHDCDVAYVLLTGRTDSMLNQKESLALGLKRAISVRSLLFYYDIPMEKIILESKGEARTRYKYGDSQEKATEHVVDARYICKVS